MGRYNLLSEVLLRIRFPVLVILFLIPGIVNSQQAIFQQKISLQRQNSSIYKILNLISLQAGYNFVYDTEVLDSDKRVRIRSGNRTMQSWLDEIIDDTSLAFNIIENHILIYRPEKEDEKGDPDFISEDEREYFTIQGRILDEATRRPLNYANVGIKGKAVGITTNHDGVFQLKLSDEYIDNQVSVSHIGYKSQLLPVKLFKDNKVDILMETDYISIQEVMIRYYDPLALVKSAIEKIDENYSDEPVYLFNFYREGVMRSNRFITYSEALFKIYKSSYNRIYERDQVRLLQSRTISNIDRTDTLILKIKGGIRSSLELDIIKQIPDFLDIEYMHRYDFINADIISVDGEKAYAVAFEQKDHITEPLAKGILYIDMESMAILGADFEVHPEYVNNAQDQFLLRRNRDYRATIDKVAYTVNYKYYDGKYHLNHVRADVHLRYRRRYQIFSNDYHVFVEMVTSRIDTGNVSRFSRRDILHTNRIFVDGNHAYDPGFWSGYSIIQPENNITEALSEIESQIESVIAIENDN